jgi:hypothetical protein
MNTASIPVSLLALLLMTALNAYPVWGEQEKEALVESTGASREELAYLQAIAKMESSEGAYAGGLSESLLSLARVLQTQGRHDEAIKVFRRSVHLTRVNEGLYCSQQIPLLRGEIASHKAKGNFTLADERQNYLYRVQTRSLQSSDLLADAFLEQAHWQYEAFQLGLEGAEGYTRLMNMWDLYRLAMKDVIEREGKTSPTLLPSLQGMLQTQYLISSYDIHDSSRVFGEDGRPNETLLRFKSYRAKSYQQGNAVIGAISDIEQEHGTGDTTAMAQTRVMLGDWQLWHGKTEAAWETYRAAQAELARADDAQARTQVLFSEPVALPDFANLNPLPPVVAPEQADILFAFSVSEKGKVQDLERMDDKEVENKQASRLMRQLRRTPFRPRFEAGQPVETEKIVKAFDLP